VSILVWSMVGIALWHFAVLVPDKFWGDHRRVPDGAGRRPVHRLPAADAGDPDRKPRGIEAGLYAFPGSVLGLVALYLYGARVERRDDPDD
jgi:hypothetical protein